MHSYRIELRIFGLLAFALVASILLAVGLHAAEAQGKILGITFTIAGPAAAFIVMVLIFFSTGLFKFGLEWQSDELLKRPHEKLSTEEIEQLLDELEMRGRRITRRTRELKAVKDALANNATPDQAMIAGGMRPAGRRG